MTNANAPRITRSFSHNVDAPPERVFPLLCPVREYDWIPYWQCRMVYSQSGFAEDNCIFTTAFAEMGEAVWVVSRYDAQNFRIEFVVTSPDTHVETINIQVARNADGSSTVNWQRTYTALNETGVEKIRLLAGERFEVKMTVIAKALNHYCVTGEMLKLES